MQIPITLSRHTKANRGKLILFQYRLPFSAFQGHSWYSDKPNYIAENTFNLYTLCCFFEKHKAWLTPNPHLLPLICPGLMVWAPFPKVFISIYFISVLLKTDISICYLDLLNFNPRVSTACPFHPPHTPSSFLKAGLLSTTDVFHLPTTTCSTPRGASGTSSRAGPARLPGWGRVTAPFSLYPVPLRMTLRGRQEQKERPNWSNSSPLHIHGILQSFSHTMPHALQNNIFLQTFFPY